MIRLCMRGQLDFKAKTGNSVIKNIPTLFTGGRDFSMLAVR